MMGFGSFAQDPKDRNDKTRSMKESFCSFIGNIPPGNSSFFSASLHAKTIFIALLGFLPCCAGPAVFEYDIRRQVTLPSDRKEHTSIAVREIRYLLAADPAGEEVCRQALAGKWQEAQSAWEGKADCESQNNLALAFEKAGKLRNASQTITRALALCPDNQEIRSNFRGISGHTDALPEYIPAGKN